ncbi:TPA: hypothetical protein DEP21_01380 [Patescibacteria group bacterium]|nr:hypothetical protein [Candidatus Gracilibacteria bacterium]
MNKTNNQQYNSSLSSKKNNEESFSLYGDKTNDVQNLIVSNIEAILNHQATTKKTYIPPKNPPQQNTTTINPSTNKPITPISPRIINQQEDIISNIEAILNHPKKKKKVKDPITPKPVNTTNRKSFLEVLHNIFNFKRIDDNLSPQEKEEIITITQDTPTPEEIEKKLTPRQRDHFSTAFPIKKIMRSLGILTVTAAIAFGIYTYAQYQANKPKKAPIKETPEKVIPQKTPEKHKFPEKDYHINPDSLTVDNLRSYIPNTNLTPDISYEDIIKSVNSINSSFVKDMVKNSLRIGDIVHIKEIVGMNKNSQYTSNKADNILDKTTLQRLTDPLFYLQNYAFLSHPKVSQDVKDVYKKFLDGTLSNEGQHYVIVSKNTAKAYLFDKENRYIFSQDVLLGKDLGKKGEWVPYPYYETTEGRFESDKPVNRNTPE